MPFQDQNGFGIVYGTAKAMPFQNQMLWTEVKPLTIQPLLKGQGSNDDE
jgi:hypothetical protein